MASTPPTVTGSEVPQDLHTAEEIAALLKVDPKTVFNWAKAGIIPEAIRQGKVIHFRKADVMKALDEARRQRGNPLAQDSAVRLGLWLVAPDEADRPSWLLMPGVLGVDAAFSLIPPGFQPISDFTAMATLPVPEGFRWFPGEFAAALGGGLGRRWAR